MKKNIAPNPISFTALYIEAFFGEKQVATATGFLWENNNQKFLITNWHVVTGFDPKTQQPLDPNGITPDKLKIQLRLKENLKLCESYEIPLFSNQDKPLWKVHKDFQSKVDVAVIKIDPPEKFKTYPINKIEFTDFKLENGFDVFIVGFPKGISGGLNFPIWKRGSIASEPEIDLDNVPKVLIDGLTREGMSGSPVIAQYVGVYSEDPNNLQGDDWFGTGRKLLGIYSGRIIGHSEFEAHLGIVWKASVIEDIVNSGIHPN